MSQVSVSGRHISLDFEMKNQIASMLKNVIDDDLPDTSQFEEEIHNLIFDQSDSNDDYDGETQPNTTMPIDFSRSTIEKSQTTKLDFPIQFFNKEAKEVFIDSSEISRKTCKKFQTTSIKCNPFSQNDFNYSFSFNNANQLNNLNLNNNNIGSGAFSLGYPIVSMNSNSSNSNNYIQHNYLKNKDNSFSLKQRKQGQQQGAFSDECVIISQLSLMLSPNCSFDMEVYKRLKGSFVCLIKNQQTSRLCQSCIDNTSSEVIHLIYNELNEQIAQLLLDPYANYFCLKLFYFLSKEDRISFLENIVQLFDILSVNKIATYPIQCIIENVLSIEEKTIIAQASYNHLMKLALDVYGTHVLEKIIVCFDYTLVRPISLFILDNFCFLANNANGLCIIKKEIILEYHQEHFNRLRKELIINALVLIQNPYGNYALQIAIDNWDLAYTEEIMKQFVGKCSMLSIQKYSSNVIERCIEKSEQFLSLFINELYLNPCTMIVLMKNNFGNYVIQTALKSSKFHNRNILITVIQGSFDKLNDKKLVCKWNSIILSQLKTKC